MPYCSSDSWSGATPPGGPAPDPSSATFSFMGSLIVQEVVRDLAAMGLHNDSHILLAGTRYATSRWSIGGAAFEPSVPVATVEYIPWRITAPASSVH